MRQISAHETLMDLLFSQAMRTQEYWTGVYDTCCVINMHEGGLLKVWRVSDMKVSGRSRWIKDSGVILRFTYSLAECLY